MISTTRTLQPAALTALAVVFLFAGRCCAQTESAADALFPPPPTQSATTRAAVRSASVDAKTCWAFRALPSVTVHTPIVRLGDVVRPLDPDMAGWQRLSRSPIGLVPIGGQAMTIDRQRLGNAITSAEATARTIEWIGAERISVHYRPHPDSKQDSRSAIARYDSRMAVTDSTPTTAQASHQMAVSHVQLEGDLPEVDPVLIKRLIYWIELAVGRHYQHVDEAHAISIDPNQASLRTLQAVSGVDHVQFNKGSAAEGIGEGKHRVQITGRSKEGPIRSDIEIVLKAHPVAIVPRESFRSGHRFQRHDLTTRPIPEEEWDDRFVTHVDSLIGMEAKTTIRENVPILRDSYGPPILIRRNDHVELRVIGGGIRVTTNGKALEEGSESDLIEVETTEPRKRLIARVVGPGLVEIVTRAPRVSE